MAMNINAHGRVVFVSIRRLFLGVISICRLGVRTTTNIYSGTCDSEQRLSRSGMCAECTEPDVWALHLCGSHVRLLMCVRRCEIVYQDRAPFFARLNYVFH